MPPAKVTVYLKEPIRRLLDERKTPGQGDSVAIQACVERYHVLVTKSVPTFSSEQWNIICSKLRDLEPPHPGLFRAWLQNTLGADEELDRTIREMSEVEIVALVDAVERFWCAAARGEAVALPGARS